MHEFSIALNIVEIAENEARKANLPKFDEVQLEIGQFSGVEISSLEFAWPAASKNTKVENSQLVVFAIKGLAKCLECGEEFECEQQFDPCPKCNSYFKEVLKGKELKIKKLIFNN